MKRSKHSVVISSPKLYHIERNDFVKILKDIQANGIEVAIITSTVSEQTDYLKGQGFSVRISPKLSLCSCVIDKSTIWYGSVNILGYQSEEDSIITVTDSKLANELLEVVLNSTQ